MFSWAWWTGLQSYNLLRCWESLLPWRVLLCVRKLCGSWTMLPPGCPNLRRNDVLSTRGFMLPILSNWLLCCWSHLLRLLTSSLLPFRLHMLWKYLLFRKRDLREKHLRRQKPSIFETCRSIRA